jgi:hypothetical protein
MFVFASRSTIMLDIEPLQKNTVAMTTMDSEDDH